MNIHQQRIANVSRNGREYAISRIYVNGVYECDAIEDLDRGLDQRQDVSEIMHQKKPGRTAIPVGEYVITLSVRSPKFSKKEYYKNFCNGYLPRFTNVKGYLGVLIHRGTNENSSAGCIIVGRNTIVGAVTNSQACFEQLYKKMHEATQRGEKINYTITRKYKV